ncbi:hypothetical protein GGI42DRAFT_176979 [Trichoderma sp. SZMC 28013]
MSLCPAMCTPAALNSGAGDTWGQTHQASHRLAFSMSLSIRSDPPPPRLSHHRAACERFRKHEMETRIPNHMDRDEKPVLNPVAIAEAFQLFWPSDLELPRDAYAGVVASHDRHREWHEAGSILGPFRELSRAKRQTRPDQVWGQSRRYATSGIATKEKKKGKS